MRRLNLLIPSLALVLLNSAPPRPPRHVKPAHHAEAGPTASANPNWMAEVAARVRDAGYQFFADAGDFRAELPERGLTARFDDAGAHIVAGDGTPISLRTSSVGRAGANVATVSAPALGDCQEGKFDPSGHCIPRLEYASAELTEWWEASSKGFEQGWVVKERPVGSGLVRIDVAVGNADAMVESGNLKLRGDNGSALVVSRLRAWDARGDSVPVRFEGGDDGFCVVVDDVGAVYPVEVDPVYTSADWVVEGVAGGDEVANAVAGAGDTNGDGYDDVLVASDTATYVFLGSSTGVLPIPAATLAGGDAVDGAGDVNGDGFADIVVFPNMYLGGVDGVASSPSTTLPSGSSAVSGAGDVNGDGYDDVITGGDDYAYVYLGSAEGLSPTPATTLIGEQSDIYNYFGSAVSDAGDVNGDGYDDVIVGDPMVWTDHGAAYVYLGSAAGLDSTANAELHYNYGDFFGYSVSGAGDVDGDGYDDVIIGAPINPALFTSYGSMYVFWGTPGGTSASTTTTFTGPSNFSHFGENLAGAGDVNQDGYGDIIVGTGSDAYLYTGSGAGLNGSATAWLDGSSIAGAGDTNGDGYDDVIIGASPLPAVYRGSDTATMSNFTELGQTDDSLGIAVANAGDVNGDGYEDLIVGAYAFYDFAGEALIYHGSASGFGMVADTTLAGAEPGDEFGLAVAGAGDTNRDGYDDVIIGAWGTGDFGAAFTYEGSATGVQSAVATTITGDSSRYYLGRLVAGIGDVNADGYGDVAVGVSTGVNSAEIYLGSSAGTSAEASGNLALSDTPSSIACAGDVNGDGYDDLIIGCEEHGSNTGAVYFYEGSSSGTSSAPSTSLAGESSGDLFGHAVASAGDANGDGYDDIIVGAYETDGNAGRAYLYSGSPTGLSSAPGSTLDGHAGADHFGAWVAPAGDANGDGYDDVCVSAVGYGATGGLYVYAGSAGGITGVIVARTTGIVSLGTAITTGDFNGDGLSDIVVGDATFNGNAGRVSGYYGCVDRDGDGYCESADCDDNDPASPFAVYADADGDGYGDAAAGLDVCAATAGYVTDGSDCDDANALRHPDNPEVCDDVDNDCDGQIDNNAVDQTTWYQDLDEDGYTNPESENIIVACDQPNQHAAESAEPDCDDYNRGIHPGAQEQCNSIDDDCDGEVDEGFDLTTWYADSDDDGFTTGGGWTDCSRPQGYATQSAEPDCDDTDPDIHAATTLYADSDGDGFTNPEVTQVACAVDGYATLSDAPDCDDTNPNVYPGATDPPDDGIDQNCNGRDTPGKSCGGCSTQLSSESTLPLLFLALLTVRRRDGGRST